MTGPSVVIDHIRLISLSQNAVCLFASLIIRIGLMSVGQVALTGIDLPSYFSEKVLRIADVQVSDAVLQNLKNQKIPVPGVLFR